MGTTPPTGEVLSITELSLCLSFFVPGLILFVIRTQKVRNHHSDTLRTVALGNLYVIELCVLVMFSLTNDGTTFHTIIGGGAALIVIGALITNLICVVIMLKRRFFK